MSPRRKEWVRLPTGWVQENGLKKFRWVAGEGGNQIAALMTLIVIAHHADDDGRSFVTYDVMSAATHLSRAKISAALSVLEGNDLIERGQEGRSGFRLTDFSLTEGWSKLPARRLYTGGHITAFSDFKLRNPAELNAMKLYLLFVARRGNDTNLANIGYDKITEYTGVDRPRIKQALSILTTAGLVHVERLNSLVSAHGVSNGYRLVGIDSHTHMGTTGRRLDPNDLLG